MKDVLLKLSDDEYHRLKWIADKIGLNISDCLRSFIPNVKPPKAKIIKQGDVAMAKFDDLVPVAKLSDKEKQKLRRYLNELMEKRWAVTLAKEIKQQVLDEEGNCLTVGTYKRLARWISPYRWSEREQYVKPRAVAISRLLFGRRIDRVN